MNRKLVVGILGVRGLPNGYGGFERFVELLVENQIFESNIEFRVYVESQTFENYRHNVKLVSVETSKTRNPFLFYFISAHLASKECDVVLSCGVGVSVGAMLVKMRGKILLVNPDGIEWQRSKWNKIQRLLIRAMYYPALKLSDVIIYDSKALIPYFPPSYAQKSAYIPYQATTSHTDIDFDLTSIDPRITKRFALVICRLEPENSILEIIQAYMSVKPDFDLVVVGNTDTALYHSKLEKYKSKIIFTSGIYNQHHLNNLRAKCVAYIHGHTVGGTNPSLLEALVTVNAPILSKNTTFNLEVLGSNVNLFDDRSELEYLLNNLHACIPNDVEYKDERYTADKIARDYYDVFTKKHLL